MHSSNYKRESETKKQVVPSKIARSSMMTSDEYSKLHQKYQKELKGMADRLTDEINWQNLKLNADNAPEEEWTGRDGSSGTARYLDWINLDNDVEFQTRILNSPDPRMATGVLEYLLDKKVKSHLGNSYSVAKDDFTNTLKIVCNSRSYGLDYS